MMKRWLVRLMLILMVVATMAPAVWANSFVPGTDPVVQSNTAQTATGVGTPADTAWTGSGSGSVIAMLKAIYNKLAGLLTVQDTAAEASLATVASNTAGVATAANQAAGNASAATTATNSGSLPTIATNTAAVGATPVGTAAPPFTVTSSDQAISGLTLPGRICLTNPQQAFGSAAYNQSYINVNWSGGNSATAYTDQLAPGVGQVCKYITGSTAPHVSTNGGGASVAIGVQQ